MQRFVDLTGQRFHRWAVLERAENDKHRNTRWLCECDCGSQRVVKGDNLRSGGSRSCGCLARELAIARGEAHISIRHPLQDTHKAMLYRCGNHRAAGYANYGGRGIKVCERWQGPEGFPNFLSDMGEKPSPDHSIDRINNDGNYTPENCRWATHHEQNNNSRHNHWVEIGGIRMTVLQAARIAKISYNTLHSRLSCGWSAERAVLSVPRKSRISIK